MDGLQICKYSSIDWVPSPVIALATSPDQTQVASAREDGSLEIYVVSPGSINWHCQLTIQGNPDARVSSLIWCSSNSGSGYNGRLLSSSLDGSIAEWDLFFLQQKILLNSNGVSVWQMAQKPCTIPSNSTEVVNVNQIGLDAHSHKIGNGNAHEREEIRKDMDDKSDEEDASQLPHTDNLNEGVCIAVGCDDGSVHLYDLSDADSLIFRRSFPRVSGRILSVAWSADANCLFSGSSDGFIRCWNTQPVFEVYRINAGLGGVRKESDLCVWSLLYLRHGVLVSGDSTGSIQFWDCRHGTLIQAHSCHKGDVNALVTVPGQNKVFSAGSDGQVILFKLFNERLESASNDLPESIEKWSYVHYVRAHTHDVRALTVAFPINTEDRQVNVAKRKARGPKKPLTFSYEKWARIGTPFLISAGDDAKLFTYSAKNFTKFGPHDICHAPQRIHMHLTANAINGSKLLLVQHAYHVDVLSVESKANLDIIRKPTKFALMARIKSKALRKISCSVISDDQSNVAYSDHDKPHLFKLKYDKRKECVINQMQMPQTLPFAHAMVFSSDSLTLILAGHDGRIYLVDVEKAELLHTLELFRKVDTNSSLMEPPIHMMYVSSNNEWLVAINSFGDIYVISLDVKRQHWFIPRLNGTSVKAGGFFATIPNAFVLVTSSSELHMFDLNAKQLVEWFKYNTYILPKEFSTLPGEVIGFAFPPSPVADTIIVYSSSAICMLKFHMMVHGEYTGKGHVKDIQSPSALNTFIKRRREELKDQTGNCINSYVKAFSDPILFIGYLSESSLLIVERSWLDVIQSFNDPVHKHVFGT